MKKMIALTLLALATAACDVGVAGSSTPAAHSGGNGGECMKSGGCPTMSVKSAPAAAAENCGECLSEPKSDCKEGACEMPPAECETKCETQKACDSTKQECAPKSGN